MIEHDRNSTDQATRDVTGVILAGGLSRRMGGGDKGLSDLGGKPMLAHVIARLAPQTRTLVLNGNGDLARFASLGLPVTADTIADFPGPLAGVLAGMRWANHHTAGAADIVTVPADAPLLPADLVARLQEARAGRPDVIAVAQSEGVLHPIIALWPLTLADDLEASLRAGVRAVRHYLERHAWIAVSFPKVAMNGHLLDPFFNANTPDDLVALRASFKVAEA